MIDYEKLGAFYLGRRWLREEGLLEDPVLYDSKDLTTHGLIVGMTGSGKTGLSIGIIEEAAIDGIPTVAIDPKGDMGNLLLTFPALRPEDFEPWIDPAEATRRGQTAQEAASATAQLWREGLAEWGQEPSRIQRFRDSVELSIYTPGSGAGIPLSVLRSFAAPSSATLEDDDARRERVTSAVAGLLALLGIEADPIQSREHILLSNLLERAWTEGRDVDLGTLIHEIQSPPFDKLGVLDIESFFPSKDRAALAMRINNLLASPGFAAWMEGEPLDFGRLLYTADGRPRVSVISIAHLSDAERMFVVTLLLEEALSWMRAQSGTSSLRALLYMDEIFGFFPPSRQPPSKTPMLTLLKQARAYGLGVLLATQNPVDLDYKGLSNCGTWFIGRLQTERDKERVLDGLESASNQAGQGLDPRTLSDTIGSLGKRVFLMNNVHEDGPELFQTRWVLSYLRGPLVRGQIETLMADRKQELEQRAEAARAANDEELPGAAEEGARIEARRPTLPDSVHWGHLKARSEPAEGTRLVYRPMLYGRAQLHFKRLKAGVDDWMTETVVAPIDPKARALDWDEPAKLVEEGGELSKRGLSDASYTELSGATQRETSWSAAKKKLATLLYRTRTLEIYEHAALGEYSEPGQSEAEFRLEMVQRLREERDREVEKLREKHASALDTLDRRIATARERVEREQSQYSEKTLSSAISFGTSLMGALLGRKKISVTNVRRAGTAMRSLGRSRKEKEDVERAEENVEELVAQRQELAEEFERETAELLETVSPSEVELEAIEIRPLKSDITVEELALAWAPWQVDDQGIATPLFDRLELDVDATDR